MTPQSNTRRTHDLCDQSDDDLFSEMQYATGPGDIIPGRAFGGGANCDRYFQIGTWWRISNFDIITGAGDVNGFCTDFYVGSGSPGGPVLRGSATDFRYDAIRGLVALDMRLPGDKDSTRSFLLTYRGPEILLDGSICGVGQGQTSATFDYWIGPYGPTALGSDMQVNIYQGSLGPLGPFLGYGGGLNPRPTSINE